MQRIYFTISIILFFLYLPLLYLIKHPDVSDGYKEYYIDRTASDWRILKYEADIKDGVDFSIPGTPYFIVSIKGISVAEHWGRWTDARLGPQAEIEYIKPFNGNVCVSLLAFASENQVNKPVTIRLGNKNEKIILSAGPPKWHYINFSLGLPANKLSIMASNAARPTESDRNNNDRRIIGVGLTKIKIEDGVCTKI